MSKLTHRSYSAGHPWYYVLGGDIPPLRTIRDETVAGDYRGYLEADILAIGKKPEPQRSQEINDMREGLKAELRKDISIYRHRAFELRQLREALKTLEADECEDIHVSMSLKHNHIVNGFANLKTLDSLPQQIDLFAGL